MEGNQVICEHDRIVWRQVVRNKSNVKLAERIVPLPDDLHQTVAAFAEFCSESRGDRYSSVGIAMNEIGAQSKELVEKVDAADKLEEVESYGLMLESAISLFKALESYYLNHFEPRTGTGGD